MVMVTKKRPKPRTHSTRPIVSSCQNKLRASALNDRLSAFREARISALIIRLGRVPLYRTKMIGMAKTGVMIVTFRQLVSSPVKMSYTWRNPISINLDFEIGNYQR
jgi:hypothetical protein